MSKTVSPVSATLDETIQQVYGRRVDCELRFDQIKRILNNRVTLDGIMLGREVRPFPIIEPFINVNDPETKARNATTAGKITQRVKDELEREKVMTKASILLWFHKSLEGYLSSAANPT